MSKRTYRSRYKPTPDKHKKPVSIREKDIEIFKLFAPGQFRHLTADLIAAATQRPLNRVQHRLRDLSDHQTHDYLRRYQPPHEQIGGSQKIVYRLGALGAACLRDHLQAELDRQIQAGHISPSEIESATQNIKKIKPLKFDSRAYHQQMQHRLTTNFLRVLVMAACRHDNAPKLLYHYPDHYLWLKFSHPHQQRPIVIEPDLFFGWQTNNTQTASNFFVEVHRPTRKTKQASKTQKRNIEVKLRDYADFWQFKGYRVIPNEHYPDVKDWKNMRVLIVTDTGETEHENLIRLARGLDERGQGLRIFWFAKKSDFSLTDPQSLFASVWRTPVRGDRRHSLLE